MDEPYEARVARVVRALHDSHCPDGTRCTERLTLDGRYGRVAVKALSELAGRELPNPNPFADR